MSGIVKPKPPPCPPSPGDLFMSWEQMKQVREMIKQIMSELIINDPGVSALLQRYIIEALSFDPHVNNTLTTVINQQIAASKIGVTDGSNALPGQIGEFFMTDIAVPFDAYPAVTDTIAPLVSVPAGDWDMRMNMDTSSGGPTPTPIAVGAFSSWIDSPPAGLSNQLTMVQYPFVAGMTADSIVALNSCVARGSFSQSTPLSVRVVVNQSSDPLLLGGQVFMHFEARRMR